MMPGAKRRHTGNLQMFYRFLTTVSATRIKFPILICGKKVCKSLPKISVPPVDAPFANVRPIPAPYRIAPNAALKNISSLSPGQ